MRERRIDRSEENDESEKETRYREKKSTIANAHLLLQLETFHLVLVLKGSLLDLKSLETFETSLDFDGQIFDIAGTLSEEAS